MFSVSSEVGTVPAIPPPSCALKSLYPPRLALSYRHAGHFTADLPCIGRAIADRHCSLNHCFNVTSDRSMSDSIEVESLSCSPTKHHETSLDFWHKNCFYKSFTISNFVVVVYTARVHTTCSRWNEPPTLPEGQKHMSEMFEKRPITEAIDEVFRELNVRKRIYGRWVKEQKMTRQEAIDRGERMEAALEHLMNHPACPKDYKPREEQKEVYPQPW